MKKFTLILLVALLVLSLGACGGSGASSSGPVYTVDVNEVDPNVYPDDYPLIGSDEFEASFIVFKEANLNAEIKNYKDVVDILGVDGAYYKNCDLEYGDDLYKYYGWYGEDYKNVVVTFKADGKNLEFYAYVSNGIN